MKRQLYIIGAGSMGREIESWLDMSPEVERDWELLGFLDSQRPMGPLEDVPSDYENLGDESHFTFTQMDQVIIAIADPKIKSRIHRTLEGRVDFFSFIAPDVIVGKFSEVGEGSIVYPRCVISTNSTLGACTFLNWGTQIGHDVKIGNYSSLMANVDVGGNCHLGDEVYMGSRSAIAPGLSLGDKVKVSIGSVVINSYDRPVVLFGNPARVIRTVD